MSTVGPAGEECHSHGRHNIGNQIDTLLLRPSSYEHKQIGVGVLLDVGPLLRLPLVLGSLCLGCGVNLDITQFHRLLVKGSNIGWV